MKKIPSWRAIAFSLFLILYTHTIVLSQGIYQSLVGGLGNDLAWSVTTSVDKDLIFAGYTESWGAGGRDVFVCKFNSFGGVEWAGAYGTALNEECHCIIRTHDNGYLLVGMIATSTNSNDALVIKLSSTGNIQWAHRYGGTGSDMGSHAIETDSSYFIVGNNGSYNGGYTDIFVISLRKNGEMRFSKIYGFGNHDSGVDVVEADNGHIIVLGGTYQSSTSSHDIYWMDLDTAGVCQKMTIFGNTATQGGFSITHGVDSGYIVTGYTTISGTNEDVIVVKLTPQGDLQWIRRYGGSLHEGGLRIIQNNEQTGYIVFGFTQSYGMGASDIFIMNLDPSGLVSWAKTIGSTSEEGYAFKHYTHLGIARTDNGTYAFADYSTGFNGNGLKDAYCGIIDSWGWTCGNTLNINPSTVTQSFGSVITLVSGTLKTDSASVTITKTPLTLVADSLCFAIVTGQQQLVEADETELYPNPARDRVAITLPEDAANDIQVLVYTPDHRLVKQARFERTGPVIYLELRPLPPGCYIVQIIDGDRCTVKKLLIL
jgi:hypothetical protein